MDHIYCMLCFFKDKMTLGWTLKSEIHTNSKWKYQWECLFIVSNITFYIETNHKLNHHLLHHDSEVLYKILALFFFDKVSLMLQLHIDSPLPESHWFCFSLNWCSISSLKFLFANGLESLSTALSSQRGDLNEPDWWRALRRVWISLKRWPCSIRIRMAQLPDCRVWWMFSSLCGDIILYLSKLFASFNFYFSDFIVFLVIHRPCIIQ